MITVNRKNIGKYEKYISRYSDSSFTDIVLLLMRVTGRSKASILSELNNLKLSFGQWLRFVWYVLRRRFGEPIAYILGEKDFYEDIFWVKRGVLIPRPDTETLVETTLEIYRREFRENRDFSLCEVGVGSGAVIISIAKHIPWGTFFGLDVSPMTLKVARKNEENICETPRINWVCSDLFKEVEKQESKEIYDVIVSNPPYISSDDYKKLTVSVKNYEPKKALYAHEKGNFFYRVITQKASFLLKKGGYLLFEIGDDQQAQWVKQLLEQCMENVHIVCDLSGHSRVVYGRRKGKINERA